MPFKLTQAEAESLLGDLPLLINIKDAAKTMSVCEFSMRRWIKMGRLRALKSDPGHRGLILIPRPELARLIVWMSEVMDDWRKRHPLSDREGEYTFSDADESDPDSPPSVESSTDRKAKPTRRKARPAATPSSA